MTTQQLVSQIKQKKSFLCIGLDVDLDKIPRSLLKLEDPIFEFNKAIIDATHHLCVAYKPNTAFYEAYGIKGWRALEKTISYIKKTKQSCANVWIYMTTTVSLVSRRWLRHCLCVCTCLIIYLIVVS